MRRNLQAACAAACLSMMLGATPNASAVLLVYEPFDYADGSAILGQDGGQGFTGAWREHQAGSVPAGSFTTVAGSLSHPSAALPTAGNSAILTGEFGTLQPARDFTEISGADGTTTWISYIGQRLGAAQDPATTSPPNMYPRGVNVGVFDVDEVANPGRAERVAIGNSSNASENEWSIIPEGSGGFRAGAGAANPFTDVEWAVMRIDHVGDHTVADDFYLWLSPDPSVEPSLGSADVTILSGDANAVDTSGIDFTRPFIGNESSGRPFGVLAMDELRIGTTYADMSAVPEPSTLAAAALAGLSLLVRRRV